MRGHQLTVVSCRLISCFLIGFLFLLTAYAQSNNADDNKLLEVGTTTVKTELKPPSEIKIISYNIRYRYGNDLQRLIEFFKNDKEIGGAQILGLQEVDRNRKRTRNENTARLLAHSLNMHYAWAAPPNAKGKEREEEETGVAILSPFPLSNVTRIVLPHEGPGGRYRAAIGATITMGGPEQEEHQRVRVYSIHGETRLKAELKREQLAAVIEDFEKHHAQEIKRVVVVGDFNTIFGKEVENTTKLFQDKGFSTPFYSDLKTWEQYFIELKLDWVWLKGFRVSDFGINRQIKLSDHSPLWTNVLLSMTENKQPKTLSESLRTELLELEKKDQEIRKKNIKKKFQDKKLIEKQTLADEKSTRRLKELITLFGWPGAEFVGKDGVNAAFLILQHSRDHAFQEKMLPFVEEAAKRGDIPMGNFATLVDRTRVHTGKPQLYGSQASMKEGKLIVDPIEDENRVDERRKALGLGPLAQYLKELEELYDLPVERSKVVLP